MTKTKQQIVDTAVSLFKENGYEETTVTEICKKCNITKRTFYYYFANKDDLTFEYYETLYKNTGEMLHHILQIDNTKEQLWKMLEYSIDHTLSLGSHVLQAFILSDIQKGMRFFSPYCDKCTSENRRKYRETLVSIVQRGQRSKNIKLGNAERMIHTFISAMMTIAIDWASNDGDYNEKGEVRKIFDTIF